jgi:2'-5' RNA ligase
MKTGEKKRCFFAVNLPEELKREIAETILPLVPNEGWRKVSGENLHVTMHFLGQLPAEAVKDLQNKTEALRGFKAFEAEISCAGHFNGNVLWLGFGKGNEEFGLLNGKLQQAMGTHDPKFHAHITIARNRGAEKNQAKMIAEKIGKKMNAMKIAVKSVELMESELGKSGPKYSVLFSIPFTQ